MRSLFRFVPNSVFFLITLLALLSMLACQPERRRSDAELGLNPSQAMGRRVFDTNCARCHEPYSRKGLHGPSLHNVYKKEYLPSGTPANDERITEVVVRGRAKMPAFGNSISDAQMDALLAYLKTL